MDARAQAHASARLEEGLLSVDRQAVASIIESASRSEGFQAAAFADGVIVPACTRIGDGWDAGEVTLSQMYMAARLLEEALASALPVSSVHAHGPVVGVAVLEDFHALGKRIVQTLLGSAGYDVRDLGAGVSCEALVERAVAERVEVLMVSVLMLNKALHVTRLSELLRASGPNRPMLVVGGAPFRLDPDLWRRVGADAMGTSASDALRIVADFGASRTGGSP